MNMSLGVFGSDLTSFKEECYSSWSEGYTSFYDGYCQYSHIVDYYDGFALGSYLVTSGDEYECYDNYTDVYKTPFQWWVCPAYEICFLPMLYYDTYNGNYFATVNTYLGILGNVADIDTSAGTYSLYGSVETYEWVYPSFGFSRNVWWSNMNFVDYETYYGLAWFINKADKGVANAHFFRFMQINDMRFEKEDTITGWIMDPNENDVAAFSIELAQSSTLTASVAVIAAAMFSQI